VEWVEHERAPKRPSLLRIVYNVIMIGHNIGWYIDKRDARESPAIPLHGMEETPETSKPTRNPSKIYDTVQTPTIALTRQISSSTPNSLLLGFRILKISCISPLNSLLLLVHLLTLAGLLSLLTLIASL